MNVWDIIVIEFKDRQLWLDIGVRYNCLKICYNENKVLNSFRKNYLSPQITEHIKYVIICYITILRMCWKIINKMSINSQNGFRLANWTRTVVLWQSYVWKFHYINSNIDFYVQKSRCHVQILFLWKIAISKYSSMTGA